MLKLISYTFNKNFYELAKIPFEEVLYEFEDKSVLKLLKQTESNNKDSSHRNHKDVYPPILIFQFLKTPKSRVKKYTIEYPKHFAEIFARLDIPDDITLNLVDLIIGNKGKHRSTRYELERIIDYLEPYRKRISLSDYRDLQNQLLHNWPRFGEDQAEIPIWLTNICDQINVKFIETQRLLIHEPTKENNIRKRVLLYSNELKLLITSESRKVEELSQFLEKSFPIRLIAKATKRSRKQLSIEKLENKLTDQYKIRSNYEGAGILDKSEQTNIEAQIESIQIDESIRDVIEVYTSDVEAKFEIFEPLYQKIRLFKDIINNLFLHKSLLIDKKEGFVFHKKGLKENQRSSVISVDNLSSGEQHMIVLMYDLIFNIEDNSVILIDEPEISLHISWQMKFLDNLRKVIQLKNIQYLIATHSPQIINDKWELTTNLGENLID